MQDINTMILELENKIANYHLDIENIKADTIATKKQIKKLNKIKEELNIIYNE